MQENYPIWHLDATGNILKTIHGQKKPYFYSMVSHDINNKKIIPLAEFITTAHDSDNISKFLVSIKNNFSNSLNLKKREAVAPIIVTDNSAALIKSVCETFNHCSITNYINWTFDILINKNENDSIKSCMKTYLILCQSHFFKNIVKKCDDITNGEKNFDIKKLFLFCFTLLQNSRLMEEFNEIFRSYYFIFNQEFMD